MSIPITIVTDPYEFVEKIQEQQDNELYLYKEDMFTLDDKITQVMIETYEKYQPAAMFCDVVLETALTKTRQYYNDHGFSVNGQQTVVLSPLLIKHMPTQLTIFSNLTSHAFSFYLQISRQIAPWHLPVIGCHVDAKENFPQIKEECQWVMQHVI